MVEVINGEVLTFNEDFACPDCGVTISDIEPRSVSFNSPFESYPKEIHDILIFGTDRCVKVYYNDQYGEDVYNVVFKGIIKNVKRRYRETSSEITKTEYKTFMSTIPCKKCKGQRLKKEPLAFTVADKNILKWKIFLLKISMIS